MTPNESDELTAEETREALALVELINKKAEAVLLPLIREMKIMRWAPDYRAILWNSIARKAGRFSAEARAEMRS